MDSLEQVKKLREDYERALDAVESRRAAYHEAVLGLHRDGTPLREIAQQLGLSHQRVHQIVSGEPPHKRSLRKAAGGGAAALALLALVFGGLRLAHAPPFAPAARVRLSAAEQREVSNIAFRFARSLGDRHPGSLAISQSSGGGVIHVILNGRFLDTGRTGHLGIIVPVTKITFALNPQTFHVFAVRKYVAGNSR